MATLHLFIKVCPILQNYTILLSIQQKLQKFVINHDRDNPKHKNVKKS